MDESKIIPGELENIISDFKNRLTEIKSPDYKEARLRSDFLDKLFAILGWDLSNTKGLSEKYREVIIEDSLNIDGFHKSPDYAFCLGGKKKFFVEAKTPAENIEVNRKHAYQLRRYGWSAKLPICLLTDFEEFAVYDCRVKPLENDSVTEARILYFKINQIEEYWDQFINLFSKEAVQDGLLDKYIESEKSKRGTLEVDKAFLEDIDEWRKDLAINIADNNLTLSQYDLNLAVQLTINRIIFLRICEDRGIEDYGNLLTLDNGTNTYKRLLDFFEKADNKYNSGLFHFREEKGRSSNPDNITPNLKLDDKVLKKIFNKLYFPKSPYVFSEIPADILGQVYEQFLGKIISLNSKHEAEVEEKPEVRKAGGVYYTPTYIVEYIVKNTVGKLLEKKTPNQVSKIKILDPACGSGSFLIEAYQYLLDWYLAYYLDHFSEKLYKGKNPILYENDKRDWKLTTEERKRILVNNIFGIDIDAQAVEMTKLSLLLKVLEGESEQSINKTMRLFQDRVLPDLGNNIKCGNSLIGNDFYSNKQQGIFDLEEKIRVNAFDWNLEFKDVLGKGGFDAVIGNPPYIRIQEMKESAPREVEFYKKHYRSATAGNYDIYVVFVEKGLELLNNKGLLGYILPHKFFNAKYGEPTRKLLSDAYYLSRIVHFKDIQIFNNATTYTCLLFLNKNKSKHFEFEQVINLDSWIYKNNSEKTKLKNPESTEWNFSTGKGVDLFEKLSEMPTKLENIANIFVGLQTSADTVFLFKELLNTSHSLTKVYSKALNSDVLVDSALLKPVIRSGEIGKYWAQPTAYVLFPYKIDGGKATLISEVDLERKYPTTWKYLNDNKDLLAEREHGKFKSTGWYQLYPKNLALWEQKKILVPYMVKNLSAYLDNSSNYFVNVTTGGFGLTIKNNEVSLEYLTGLLNSNLLDWFFKRVSTTFHGGYYGANKQFISQLPIKILDLTNASNKVLQNKIVNLVKMILYLNSKLLKANTQHDKTIHERQIESIKHEINLLVYILYQVTEEEIKIVEGMGNK